MKRPLRVSSPTGSSSESDVSDAELDRHSDSGAEHSDDDAADVTFEEMERLRQSGVLLGKSGGRAPGRAPQHGSTRGATGRQPTAAVHGTAGGARAPAEGAGVGPASAVIVGKRFQRENKNRPVEASSKKRPKRAQEILQTTKKEAKDPRFESLSGSFDQGRFRKQYGFLYEEALPQQRLELKSAARKLKNPAKVAEVKAQVQRLDQQLAADAQQQKRNELAARLKAKEREAVKAGKKPFYMKKSELKKAELLEKYRALADAGPGRLEAALAKRRKKNASKDHRYVPSSRRAAV